MPEDKLKTSSSVVGKQENRFKGKVFCIGFGKTGTTSLASALKSFGYKLGEQAAAEMLLDDCMNKKFDKLINYCHSADAFQDIPFWAPGVYQVLDREFGESKFILTIRNSSDEWYESLVRFHTQKFATGESLTSKDLATAVYRYKGFMLDAMKWLYHYPQIALYDQEPYKKIYEGHIAEVKAYFKDRHNDLLVLNLEEKNSYQKLASFLGICISEDVDFPWLNKSRQFV